MAEILHVRAISSSSSTSTVQKRILRWSKANFSYTGCISLQGLHHEAVNLTITLGKVDTILSNSS